MAMVKTPFEEIKVKKPKNRQRTSPTEEAALVAMSASGATWREISEKLGRSNQWIAEHKKKMAAKIAEYSSTLLENEQENLGNIIVLSRYRMQEQLVDDGIAAEIPIRDLAQVHKEAFNARQILRKEPTDISGIPGTEIKGREDIDRIAISEEFNRNFKKIQRAAIMGETIEAEEGDFVECPPD